MMLSIYPLKDGYSFRAPEGPARPPIRVVVPPGSQVRDTKLFGPQLFVPAAERTRVAWSARQVVQAATERQGDFRLV
jgi:hypothetical protein